MSKYGHAKSFPPNLGKIFRMALVTKYVVAKISTQIGFLCQNTIAKIIDVALILIWHISKLKPVG
jgi:hypothetical protein